MILWFDVMRDWVVLYIYIYTHIKLFQQCIIRLRWSQMILQPGWLGLKLDMQLCSCFSQTNYRYFLYSLAFFKDVILPSFFCSPCHPIHILFFFLKNCAMSPVNIFPICSPWFPFKPEATLLLSLVICFFLIVLFPSFSVRNPEKFWACCSALCLSHFMENKQL